MSFRSTPVTYIVAYVPNYHKIIPNTHTINNCDYVTPKQGISEAVYIISVNDNIVTILTEGL